MRSLLASFGFILLIAIPAAPALAVPPPMSQEELLQKSDLVALVRIRSVTCLSVSTDPGSGETLPSWSAKAELMEVIKGEDVKGDTVDIDFEAIPTGVLGPWTVYYYPGEMVWTHLVGKDGEYTTTWWNGRGELISHAIITELPTTPGETAEIPKRGK